MKLLPRLGPFAHGRVSKNASDAILEVKVTEKRPPKFPQACSSGSYVDVVLQTS